VQETVRVEVPAVEYVVEPVEIEVRTMTPVEEEIDSFELVYEEVDKEITVNRIVQECVEETVQVKKRELVPETRTRQVWRSVVKFEKRPVCRTVYDIICDPCTGKETRVARTVETVIEVPVRSKVCETEEYIAKVATWKEVPVTRIRVVEKCVPEKKVVKEKVCRKVPVKKKVTVMRPTTVKKTVNQQKKVCTTKTVDKKVWRRVQVPCEPEPVCPNPPPCQTCG
jgi:hypothetical protein